MLPREDKLPVLPPFPDDREGVLDLGLLLRDVDDLLDVRRQLLDVQVDEGVNLELPDGADAGFLLKPRRLLMTQRSFCDFKTN